MGTWGIKLTDDDLSSDIISDFFDLYNDGENPKNIRHKLEKDYESTIEDTDEGHVFWLSLAKAQWDINALDTDVFEKVLKIEKEDVDGEIWRESNVSEKILTKRREAIHNFVEKLKTPNQKPKKPKKIRLKDAHYETGDVLVFRTQNGYYGVAVVVGSEKQTRYGVNQVVTLNIKQKIKLTVEEIVNADVLVSLYSIGSRKESKIEVVNYSTEYKKDIYKQFEIIAKLKVKKVITTDMYTVWNNLVKNFEGSMARVSKEKLSLKKFLGYNILQKIEIIS